jgi:hypothetical protein
MATAQLFERPASMSDDIRSILDRLATVEGRLSPAQQKVPQLPALFKPRHIRALGSKTDPAHPMDGYMVGDSVEPTKTALEEAMAEIEEDMLSKVKKDLTQYLDRLEKKVSIDRDLKDKAQDAVQKGKAEEDLDEFAPVVETTVNLMKKKFYVNWPHNGGMAQNNKWPRHRTPWLQWAGKLVQMNLVMMMQVCTCTV